MIWDLIYFYSSFWAFATLAFRGIPLNIIQFDWNLVYRSKGLKQRRGSNALFSFCRRCINPFGVLSHFLRIVSCDTISMCRLLSILEKVYPPLLLIKFCKFGKDSSSFNCTFKSISRKILFLTEKKEPATDIIFFIDNKRCELNHQKGVTLVCHP